MNNPFIFEAEPFVSRQGGRTRYPNGSSDTFEMDELTDTGGFRHESSDELMTEAYDSSEFETGGACPPNYEKGEVELSHCQVGACQAGVLPNDVMRHPRGLLIADFGVGWSGIKAATKKEPLLQQWQKEVRSDLYSYILRIYGYSDCIDSPGKNAALRLARAERVFTLLDKDLQDRVDFKGAAKPGEFINDNSTKANRARNRGVIIELLRIPGETIIIKGTAPKQPPPPPPPPPPPSKTPQQRSWRVVGKFAWKGKKRRVAKRGYFEVFAEPEAEVTGSVNATDQEFATFAAKWETGKGPGGQFETKFNEWFKPDVKIERGKDGWKIALKKDLKLFGETLVITPHLQLSTEVVKTQVTLLPFTIPVSLFGQDVRLTVKPRMNIIVKIDLWGYLLDRLKKKITDWLGDLFRNLLESLGRKFLGALASRALAGLLGGAIAYLFLKNPPTSPVTAPPDDVNGKDRARKAAPGAASALQTLQTWADKHRHAYAKAYADTMVQLSKENWKDVLANLRSRSVNAYKALPAPTASDKDWVVWASTRKAVETISIDLPTDNFNRRFRWYELMLMFAVAAWLMRKLTKDEFDQARQLALLHASVAGMAAAVQYVNQRIADETFEFIDENDKPQRTDGVKRWDTVGALVRLAKLGDAEASKRLEPLALVQLKSLPKVA